MIEVHALSKNVGASPLFERRALLTLGLAGALVGCAPKFLSNVKNPTWDEAKAAGTVTQTGQAYERIRRVGERVLPASRTSPAWQFGFVPQDSFGVATFASNSITISRGLLALCENDGQLAALIVQASFMQVSGPVTSRERNAAHQALVFDRDKATVQALAKAGYDPRDAKVIAQRSDRLMSETFHESNLRWANMDSELRRLGYQV